MSSRSSWRTARLAPPYLFRPQSATILRAIPRTPLRNASSGGFPRPGRGQYRRFNRVYSAVDLWKTSPAFRVITTTTVGGCGVFWLANRETVPGSGRRRFNCISPETEKELAKENLAPVLREFGGKILPEWAPETRAVSRVLERLVPNSGIQDGEQWEVRVIREDIPNAFVMPGNKVFVFTGILPICENDDGLATVLGHEIAHNVAHHSAEGVSRSIILLGLGWALEILLGTPFISNLALELALNRPGSRAQEAEADYLGLLMMAKSCYDPQEAVRVWERMQRLKGAGSQIPQFISTHPSDRNRIRKMMEWLPEAMAKRENSECAFTSGFADSFSEAVRAFQ